MWPAKSPDLTPLDFCLWETLKDKMYEMRCEIVDEALLENVQRNFTKRL